MFFLQWVVLFGVLAVFSTAEADSSCATVEVKPAEVVFHLENCGEKQTSLKGKNQCKGDKAASVAKTSKGTYRVALKVSEGWGTTNLEAGPVEFKAASKPKAVERIVAAAVAKPSAKAEAAVPSTEPAAAPAEAEKEEDAGDGKITGNWGGARNDLAKKGVTVEAFYTGEVVQNFLGGIQSQTTYMAKFTLSTDLDLEKLMGWNGWAFHASAIALHGQGPSPYTGDFQLTSNIEADATSRLYDAWIQKSFADGKASFLVGLYDWNSENNVSDSGLAFLNSSFGMGAELSQVPVNEGVMVSTYPTAALGARFLIRERAPMQTLLCWTGLPGTFKILRAIHLISGRRMALFWGPKSAIKWDPRTTRAISPQSMPWGPGCSPSLF